MYDIIRTIDKRGAAMINIKNIREATGATQVELAAAIGVGQSAVAAWESGVSLPRADKLPLIAKFLGCTIDELMATQDGSCQ